MTQLDFLLIAHIVFGVLAYPIMLYCEFNSYAPGHRHVTYGRALVYLFLACLPVVSVFALFAVIAATYGDSITSVLSKPMLRETE